MSASPGRPVTVVLTQPARRATALADVLRRAGVEVAGWPMTGIDETPGLDWPAIADTLSGCRWALLPSPAAVEVVFDALMRHGLAWPAATGLGLIGPGSREALDGWARRVPGLASARVLEPAAAPYDADALLARLEFASLAGSSVAVLRRADGREAWLHTLRERGATVHALTVYAACGAEPPADAGARVAAWAARDAAVVFSIASADAGSRLARAMAALPEAAWILGRPVLTQHPRIAHALERAGWRCVIRHEPGTAALAAAIESLRHRCP